MADRSPTQQRPSGLNRDWLWGLTSGYCRTFTLQDWLKVLIIIGAVLWIYAPVFHGEWLWDDDTDITDNVVVHSPAGLWTIWTEPAKLRGYYPLTFSLEWIEWHAWGMDTLGYHLVNVSLHLIGSLLVWRLLAQLGLRLAWLGGLIFAVHPVQVESVAWIAQLKNTLCLPPFLLAMGAWINFDERKQSRDYWLSVGWFLIAMLCKTSMATFPLVILLYAWWKRNRIGWKDLKISAPFFLISLVVGMMSYQILQPFVGSPNGVALGSFFSRAVCAGLPISFYFSKCFLPVDLMPIYPRWSVDPPSLWQILPLPLWGGVIYWLWTKRRGWGRHALLGLGYFLLLLAPFLGLIQIPYMYATWVMDHELYLAIIGPIGLTIAFLDWTKGSLSFLPSWLGQGLGVFAAGLLAWTSHLDAQKFVNAETLWTAELARYPDCLVAHNILAIYFAQNGRMGDATAQLEQALKIDPNYAQPDYNVGIALFRKGQLDDAESFFRKALAIDPGFADAHYNLGVLLAQKGQNDQAITEFQEALDFNPNYAAAHNDLGIALDQVGRSDESITQFQQALENNPKFAEAHNNLGIVLAQKERLDEAIVQYRKALELNPDYAEAHNNLGLALFQKEQIDDAINEFQEAVRLKPDFDDALRNLSKAQALEPQKASP